MLKQKIKNEKEKCAQTIVEYAIILSIISVVLMAMSPLVKSGIQSSIKLVADQIGSQVEAEQSFDDGHLEEVASMTYMHTNSVVDDVLGAVRYNPREMVHSYANTFTNLGFTRED